MDNGLLFPYRLAGGKGGTQGDGSGIPNGHGVSPSDRAGAGKSTPRSLRGRGKLRGDPKRSGLRDLSRKASLPVIVERPYRKPTLVDRDKSPKVIERTLVKELGKMAP